MDDIDTIVRELIEQWPKWEADAGQTAQVEQDSAAGEQEMFNTVSAFLSRAVCRLRGHPGVVWYNAGGLEPDMHCSFCGEDLG